MHTNGCSAVELGLQLDSEAQEAECWAEAALRVRGPRSLVLDRRGGTHSGTEWDELLGTGSKPATVANLHGPMRTMLSSTAAPGQEWQWKFARTQYS